MKKQQKAHDEETDGSRWSSKLLRRDHSKRGKAHRGNGKKAVMKGRGSTWQKGNTKTG